MYKDMNNIKILPIFNQAEDGIWADFIRIRSVATHHVCGYSMSQLDRDNWKKEYERAWKLRSFNFAFGAYDNVDLVGFIQGDCVDRIATIRNLYVLPEYMGNKIGSALLNSAEKICTFGATSLDLVSLPSAQKFYEKYDYKPIFSGSNHYIKDVTEQMSARSTVVPVFKITSKVGNTCKKIAKECGEVFNPVLLNGSHRPVFIYLDSFSAIQAFAVAGDDNNSTLNMYVKPNQLKQYITGKFNKEFDNIRTMIAGVQAKNTKVK